VKRSPYPSRSHGDLTGVGVGVQDARTPPVYNRHSVMLPAGYKLHPGEESAADARVQTAADHPGKCLK
jgi:hypothetical protein